MDFGDGNGNHNEMWEWRGEEYDLQRVALDDVSHCLWGDVNQNVDDFLNILDEQTPIKDCADLTCQVSDIGDKSNKGLEECIESSQVKRRRMLQFTSESNEVTECSMMEDGLSDNVQWNSQWNFDFSDNQCSLNCEELDQSSEGWLIDCLNESEAHCSSEEMNNSVASIDHAYVPGSYNISPETEADIVQEKPTPIRAKILKGRKSFIRAPPKLTTSVAYPFALIKPCGVHGDLTLSDINRRIHAPPLSNLKHNKEEEAVPYPTSAFSGKPVVVKTKIRTEGGKGSITIMRTRG
ncbi:protein XRI1-like [Typha angustifolia]|uniref:protein XRI1-like n=1 Tax=Typha angustifolia TaxID=59011 RepID=UPI003C2C08BF